MATERKGMTLSEFEAGIFELEATTEYANMLIYGDSGSGKTVLASTLPGNNLWLVGEPGYISAARQGGRGKARQISDTASAVAAAAWLENGHAQDFNWLVVDGVSTMNTKFLLAYAAEAFDINPTKRAHRNLPDKPDYFNAQNFTKSWVSRLIDLPMNVLFTAHAMRPEDEGGETLVYPAIQGKGYEVSNYISGLMHVVGYMKGSVTDDVQTRRILWQQYTDPNNGTRYFAKDQFDALGRWDTIRDPDNPKGITMADVVARCGIGGAPAAAPKKARKARAA